MRKTAIFALVMMLLAPLSPAQNIDEKLLSDVENGYNPIPSPDGELIAYVRNGDELKEAVDSVVRTCAPKSQVMTTSGKVLSPTPLVNGFLFGWTPDGNDLICYRDSRFLLMGPYGGVSRQADETGGDTGFSRSERVAYLSKAATFVWVEHQRSPRTLLLTQSGPIAENSP